MKTENQIVGRIVERNQPQVRLQRETRIGIERGDLIQRERSVFGAVKCLHKRPLDAGDVDGKPMTAACKLRMRCKPFRQLRAKIAQRERAARMRREIGNRQLLEGARSDDRSRPQNPQPSAPSTRNQYWRL